MEAKDLMIGDYVYNHRNWECPIVEIHKNSAIVIARHYGEEEFLLSDLRPIPLTTEILEKNGFIWDSSPISQCWEQYGLIIYPVGDGYRMNCGQNVSFNIDFVHELQHLFKLCGIDKEIEL